MVERILFQVKLTTLGVGREFRRDKGDFGLEAVSGSRTTGSLGTHAADEGQHAEQHQRQEQSPTRHSISAL